MNYKKIQTLFFLLKQFCCWSVFGGDKLNSNEKPSVGVD